MMTTLIPKKGKVMNIAEAKLQILELIHTSISEETYKGIISSETPEQKDKGKFTLLELPARAIHRFNGWNVPINLNWFKGKDELPEINGGNFYWYAFAIPIYSGFTKRHYFICDYTLIREWVLTFKSPLSIDYRNQRYWRADLQLYKNSGDEKLGYFRWGDEDTESQEKKARVISFNNIRQIIMESPISDYDFLPTEDENELSLKVEHLRHKKTFSIPEGLLQPERSVRSTQSYKRDPLVIAWILENANGVCEGCGNIAPFKTPSDDPYLEIHHVHWLSKGGPDTISNSVALCPNCHQRCHHSSNSDLFSEMLYSRIPRLIKQL